MKLGLLLLGLFACVAFVSADFYDRAETLYENAARNENAKWWGAFENLMKFALPSNGNQTAAEFNISAREVVTTYFAPDGIFTVLDSTGAGLTRQGTEPLVAAFSILRFAHSGEIHVVTNVSPRGECEALTCTLEQEVLALVEVPFNPFFPSRESGAKLLVEKDVVIFERANRNQRFLIKKLTKEVTHSVKVAEYGGAMSPFTI